MFENADLLVQQEGLEALPKPPETTDFFRETEVLAEPLRLAADRETSLLKTGLERVR
jgi:hypothetical protein